MSQLLQMAGRLAPAGTGITTFAELLSLPLFDPALTVPGQTLPPAVVDLHRQVAAADAVLFATPEYAYGLPGSFKNALDWLVGAGSLYGKSTGALSASPSESGGRLALASLLLTLEALGACVSPAATLAVPLVRVRLGAADGQTPDPTLVAELLAVVNALGGLVR